MELCALIAQEQDPARFLELVTELNRILDEKHERLGPPALQDQKPDS